MSNEISNERLEEIAYGDEWYPPEIKAAVIELLADRKAWSEPVGNIYMDSFYGVQVSLEFKDVTWNPGDKLYRKPDAGEV